MLDQITQKNSSTSTKDTQGLRGVSNGQCVTMEWVGVRLEVYLTSADLGKASSRPP